MTIDNIIDDILLEIRNNNISESESLNRAQIELWVDQYRSMLIKQDIDKGRDFSTNYIQTIYDIDIVEVPSNNKNYLYFASDIVMPKTIDFHNKYGITRIFDNTNNEIQLMSSKRASINSSRKYSGTDTVAHIENGKIMLKGNVRIDTINIDLVAERPTAVPGFKRNLDEYPISINMLPTIKQLIFEKELKILMPSDNTNNSNNDIQNLNAK